MSYSLKNPICRFLSPTILDAGCNVCLTQRSHMSTTHSLIIIISTITQQSRSCGRKRKGEVPTTISPKPEVDEPRLHIRFMHSTDGTPIGKTANDSF